MSMLPRAPTGRLTSFEAHASLSSGHIVVELFEYRSVHGGTGDSARAQYRDGEKRSCGTLTFDKISSWLDLREAFITGGVKVVDQ